MNQTRQKRYVIYSRKSRFTGKGESIENQIQMCRQYIAAQFGEEAPVSVYEDEGFSGGNLDRPRFRQMMKDAESGEFAAVVVYRLDRISRNIGDFAMLIEELGRRGIGFISIREQFDTSSPMGRAMMYIASVFSQLERETIAERIRDNMHELARTGRWLGGVTPMGYESVSVTDVTVDGKVKKSCCLKSVPEEMALIRMIFRRFTETGSLTEVMRELEERRARTRQGNPFTRFALRGILTNPVYMTADRDAWQWFYGRSEICGSEEMFDGLHGIMPYNRTLQKPGKSHRINPMEEWIVAPGSHEGAVSGEMWVKVQGMLSSNRTVRRSSGQSLLSGVLFCGCCQSRMRPKLTGRTGADGEAVFVYLCTGKEKSHGRECSVKNADGNLLDRMVLEEIGKFEEDITLLKNRLEKYGKQLAEEVEEEDHAAVLRRQIREKHEKIRNLTELLGNIGSSAAGKYIAEQIGEYHEDAEHLECQLAELEEERNGDADPGGLCDGLADFGKALTFLTPEEKRNVIRSVGVKIFWDGENAHLYRGEPYCEDSK